MTPDPTPGPWPPRPGEDHFHRHTPVELPGLGAGWTLVGRLPEPPAGEVVPLAGAFGRGGVMRCGDTVLRPYRRGGLLGRVNTRVYRSTARFRREFQVHLALWRAGFPTPEPLGYAWRPCWWGMEGVFLSRYQEAEPWPRRWDLSPAVLPRLQAMVGFLAAAGLWCPDLNATNILVEPDGGVLALDWDKARPACPAGLAARYGARLLRSLLKLGAPPEVAAEVATWTTRSAHVD